MKQSYVSSNQFADVIVSCNYCHGSYGVKERIDAFLKDNHSIEDLLCLHFIEFMEINYRELSVDENLHKKEILNFSDHNDEPNMRITFIYNYLISLLSKSKTSNWTFVPELTVNRRQLIRILERLKENKFCDFDNVQALADNFYSKSSISEEGKIHWIDKGERNSSETNYRSLWLFIQKMTSFEYVHSNKLSLDKWLRHNILKVNDDKKADFLLKSYGRLNKQMIKGNAKHKEKEIQSIINTARNE